MTFTIGTAQESAVEYDLTQSPGGALILRGAQDDALGLNAALAEGFLDQEGTEVYSASQSPYITRMRSAQNATLFPSQKKMLNRAWRESEKRKVSDTRPEPLVVLYRVPKALDRGSQDYLARILFDAHKTGIHMLITLSHEEMESFFPFWDAHFYLHNVSCLFITKSASQDESVLTRFCGGESVRGDVAQVRMNSRWSQVLERKDFSLALPAQVRKELIPVA